MVVTYIRERSGSCSNSATAAPRLTQNWDSAPRLHRFYFSPDISQASHRRKLR